MQVFKPRPLTMRGQVRMAADPGEAFHLFSPLGEKLWVPGWDPELLYPPGAEWEEGMLFRTREETGEAIWVVTHLDFNSHTVRYHRVEPGRYVARIDVECRRVGDRATEATVEYSFVGLSESGNRDIAAMTRDAYDEKMARWTRWIADHLAARGRGSSERGSS
jgi:hypothetical protein